MSDIEKVNVEDLTEDQVLVRIAQICNQLEEIKEQQEKTDEDIDNI